MSKQKKNGFTLLEVLVAFTLLAATFATVMQIISGSAKNTVKASHNTKIAMLVQSKLDEIGLIEKIEEGSTFGDFDELTSWSLDIVPFEVPSEDGVGQEFTAIELMEVTLQVTSQAGNKQTVKTFQTLRAVTPDASRVK
jgi:general secretion pathway protein I